MTLVLHMLLARHRTLTSLLAIVLGAVISDESLVVADGGAGTSADGRAGVSFRGQVVDLATGKGIPGATVVLKRVLPGIPAADQPHWAGNSTFTTDKDGAFTVAFPPEQLAERRLAICIAISHPAYISRKSNAPAPVVEILTARNGGDPVPFEKINLQKGIEHSGLVVDPRSRPVAGAMVEASRWSSDENPSDRFTDDMETVTGPDGRFRLRLPKSQQLAIFINALEFAPFQHYWGPDDHENDAGYSAPTDLGQLVLQSGVRLSGRLLDTKGLPIAGQTIKAQSIYGRCSRTARSNADGTFSFGPLRQGNYLIVGAGQSLGPDFDLNSEAVTTEGSVFEPKKVYVRDGIVPDSLVIRELETVAVDVRFVDGHDRPVRGNVVGIWGTLPINVNPPAEQPAVFEGDSPREIINGEEREDTSRDSNWAVQLAPDASGRLRARVPKGLHDAQIATQPPNETFAIRSRIGADKPMKPVGAGSLESIDNDIHGVTFVYYDAPALIVKVKTEDGELPTLNMQIGATFQVDGEESEASFVEQPNGLFRSQNLVPDQEYELAAWATGFVPNTLKRVRLAERQSLELCLTLKRAPEALTKGTPAPPFVAKSVSGGCFALDEMRGKVVLLHFWSLDLANSDQELPPIRAIVDRFGADNRIAVLGMCLCSDRAQAIRFFEEKKISWPQVVLRDRHADSIVLAFGATDVPKVILIGADGAVLANGLSGDDIAVAVRKALGEK